MYFLFLMHFKKQIMPDLIGLEVSEITGAFLFSFAKLCIHQANYTAVHLMFVQTLALHGCTDCCLSLVPWLGLVQSISQDDQL